MNVHLAHGQEHLYAHVDQKAFFIGSHFGDFSQQRGVGFIGVKHVFPAFLFVQLFFGNGDVAFLEVDVFGKYRNRVADLIFHVAVPIQQFLAVQNSFGFLADINHHAVFDNIHNAAFNRSVGSEIFQIVILDQFGKIILVVLDGIFCV